MLFRSGSGGTWNVGTTLYCGAALTTNYYTRLTASGVIATPSSGVDYEFAVGFFTAASGATVSIAHVQLQVIGTN